MLLLTVSKLFSLSHLLFLLSLQLALTHTFSLTCSYTHSLSLTCPYSLSHALICSYSISYLILLTQSHTHLIELTLCYFSHKLSQSSYPFRFSPMPSIAFTPFSLSLSLTLTLSLSHFLPHSESN